MAACRCPRGKTSIRDGNLVEECKEGGKWVVKEEECEGEGSEWAGIKGGMWVGLCSSRRCSHVNLQENLQTAEENSERSENFKSASSSNPH